MTLEKVTNLHNLAGCLGLSDLTGKMGSQNNGVYSGLQREKQFSHNNRSHTVEECRNLVVSSLLRAGRIPSVASGGYLPVLNRYGQEMDRIKFCIEGDVGGPKLVLIHESELGTLRQGGKLQTSQMPGGHTRWWFGCPHESEGVVCNKRTRKLYLPPGSLQFGCRDCHNLVYEQSRLSFRQRQHAAEENLLLRLPVKDFRKLTETMMAIASSATLV